MQVASNLNDGLGAHHSETRRAKSGIMQTGRDGGKGGSEKKKGKKTKVIKTKAKKLYSCQCSNPQRYPRVRCGAVAGAGGKGEAASSSDDAMRFFVGSQAGPAQLPIAPPAAMNSRKGRRNNQNNHQNNQNSHPHSHPHLTDYESDTAYLSDMQHQQAAPPLRSNEEINLSVIRRHNPSVTAILSLAPYAVVYIFSPTTRQWEKNGVEGTLFVCQLTQGPLGEERYTAFVLNRRGLNNFDLPLTDSDNVEVTEEYVILKADEGTEGEPGENGIGDPVNPQDGRQTVTNPADIRIYGLWIYSEPAPNSTAEARTINAQLIRECAAHAGNSLKLAQEQLEAMRQHKLHVAAAAAQTQAPPLEEVQASVPMGRQISLKDLFGQQRAQDDGWSVRAHHMSPAEMQQGPGQPGMQAPPQQNHHQPPPPLPRQDVLGDLFRRAGLAYDGSGLGY